jgi:hypothetical protein
MPGARHFAADHGGVGAERVRPGQELGRHLVFEAARADQPPQSALAAGRERGRSEPDLRR